MASAKQSGIPLGMRWPKRPPQGMKGANSGKPPRLIVHCTQCCTTDKVKGGSCVEKNKWKCGAEFRANNYATVHCCPRGHVLDKRGYVA